MSIEDLTGTVVRKVCMACSREFAVAGGVCPHDGNMLVPLPQDPYVGRRIADKYHVLSVLGTGGMGVVYLARHETMEDNVAIKMLRAQFVGDQASVKRFNHEAIAARRLRHPNVITTYDHGCTHQGQPYIVMECLHGASLADELKRCKQLSVERVVHIFTQACDALDHAHKQGVIHRDLKPGNFMLINFNDDPDFVKVVDFGVAKVMPINNENAQTLTQAGEVCGSPVYMSPEQCVGQPLDRRADVYSMGVVLYEALTGKIPLLGRNMVETMHKQVNENPPSFKEARPDLYISERIEQVVMRAMAKRPEMRQQSMAILKQELLFCVPKPGQVNSNLRTISSTIDGTASISNRKWIIPALASLLVLLIAGATFFFFMQKQASKTANIATPPLNAAIPPGGASPPQDSSANGSRSNSTAGSSSTAQGPSSSSTPSSPSSAAQGASSSSRSRSPASNAAGSTSSATPGTASINLNGSSSGSISASSSIDPSSRMAVKSEISGSAGGSPASTQPGSAQSRENQNSTALPPPTDISSPSVTPALHRSTHETTVTSHHVSAPKKLAVPLSAKKPAHPKPPAIKAPAAAPVNSAKLFEHLAGELSYRRKNQ